MKKLVKKLKQSSRMLKKKARRATFNGVKHCRFCSKDQASLLDYKNSSLLRQFLTERGKILPSRISGACTHHQRELSHVIKKARMMALVPYTYQ